MALTFFLHRVRETQRDEAEEGREEGSCEMRLRLHRGEQTTRGEILLNCVRRTT